MSGIPPINPASTPVSATPSSAASAAAGANPAAAPASAAPAGDSSAVGGGQSASGGLAMYQSAQVAKETFPVMEPAPQVKAHDPIELKPYVSAPTPESTFKPQDPTLPPPKPKVPIKNNTFSLIEGPALPDP